MSKKFNSKKKYEKLIKNYKTKEISKPKLI